MASTTTAARAKAAEGHALNDQGDYVAARVAFLEAYTLSEQGPEAAACARERAILLFSAANMSLKLNELDAARRMYHEMLQMPEVDPSLRQRVHDKLDGLLATASAPASLPSPATTMPLSPPRAQRLQRTNQPTRRPG